MCANLADEIPPPPPPPPSPSTLAPYTPPPPPLSLSLAPSTHLTFPPVLMLTWAGVCIPSSRSQGKESEEWVWKSGQVLNWKRLFTLPF